MSRVQLALNVSDLDDAIAFYSKLFDTEPAKVRPGYANYAIAEPPLKLVLVEGGGAPGSLNHLGIEVAGAPAVATAAERLAAAELRTDEEHAVSCCYAVQDKVWVHGPDATAWEVYTVLADADPDAGAGASADRPGSPERSGAACCAHRPDLADHVPPAAGP